MSVRERGFTLIEMVVAVAIMVILAFGALWLFGMHPAALRTAVDGFDQRYGEARALAAKTGNGATIVFVPRSNGGYTMTVYAGRPKDNASVSAMQLDDLPAVVSDASIAGPFGSPPFAIFLSSAGKPSGKAAYPSVDSAGAVSFAVIAQQPSCPDQTNGIVLTFRGPNGATDTRSIGCDGITMLSGTAAPQPSMTPEALRIDNQAMLAHWTSDTGPLHFRVGEFGYTHWFASGSIAGDARCGDAYDSDSGAPPVAFAAGWPYQTSSSAEMNRAPAPPSLPYTWAVQQSGLPPDQPPGAFTLSPVHLNGGQCTVKIVDDNGQSVTTSAHVMGDLLVTLASPKLQGRYPSYTMSLTTTDAAQQITTGKTFDNEAIALAIGGACGGILSRSFGASSAGDNAHRPSLAQFTLTPQAPGTCVAHVTDQYGEPGFDINVTVKRPLVFNTWPASLAVGIGGTAVVANTSRGIIVADAGGTGANTFVARLGPILNALLGGGVAHASSTTCYAQAFAHGTSGAVDYSVSAQTLQNLGISLRSDGCIMNASGTEPYGWNGTSGTGVMVAYEPGGNPGNFNDTSCATINKGLWYPGLSGVQVSQPVTGTAPGSCNVTFSDGLSSQQDTPDNGIVAVTVTGCTTSAGNVTGSVGVGEMCTFSLPSWVYSTGCPVVPQSTTMYVAAFTSTYIDNLHSTVTAADMTSSLGSFRTSYDANTDKTVATFTRSAPGAVNAHVYRDTSSFKWTNARAGQCESYETATQAGSITIN